MTGPADDKAAWNKRVLPHGELQPLGDRMWMVTGTLPNMPLPRNMIVFKMDDGGLLIHNAIALNEAAMAKLEALGKPSVLVVPSPHHRLDAPAFKARYPDLHVVAPASARAKVEQKVHVDAAAEEELPKHGIVCHAPRGIKSELVYEMPCGDGHALVFNDALFNLQHQPGVGGFFLKLLGSTGYFGVTKTASLFILDDKKAYAGWLREMARKSDVRVITVAHGDAVDRDASAALEGAAARLAP
jgi:hypothetical protein